MRTTPLTPFGHAVTGIDLGAASDDELAAVRRLATTGGVVVLPGQALDDTAFAAVLRRLAPLTFTAGETPVPGHADLNVVSNVGRTRPPRSVFHSDTSYVRAPPSFTALRAVRVPRAGGSTLFSNQYLAHASLSARRQRELVGAEVLHEVTGVAPGAGAERRCWQPLLRRHPETGRIALYLSTPERCTAVRGIPCADPAALVADLYRHSIAPERLLAHRWGTGDIVLWDNRCTMHRADHSAVDGDRVLHRGMCAGEVPAAA